MLLERPEPDPREPLDDADLVGPCPRCGGQHFVNGHEHGIDDPYDPEAHVEIVCATCHLIYGYDRWFYQCGGEPFPTA